MLKIVTDTGSDITYQGAAELGLISLELPVLFEGMEYNLREDLDFSQFYANLVKSKNLPTTSQVTPGQYLEVFEEAKKAGDEVLVVALSSGLSGTYQSAVMAKEQSEYDKITVVDSMQAIGAQRIMAEHAVKMRDEGKEREEIAAFLVGLRGQLVVCGVLDTLTYLKKGGRVPPAMALIGNVIGIKPAILLQGGKLEQLGKARGFQAGKQILWTQLEKDGFDRDWPVVFAHCNDAKRCEEFRQMTVEKYGIEKHRIVPIGGVIGTHLGPGTVIISYKKP
jgi:DegV family protein with EDD domain